MQAKFLADSEANNVLSPRPSHNVGFKTSSTLENLGAQAKKASDVTPTKVTLERPHSVNETRANLEGSANNNNNAPATK